MDLHNLNVLKRNSNTGLYDLNKTTYKYVPNIATYTYIVEKHEEMRIDLVSNSIYQTTQYVDFLLDYNNIDNPLNIKEGDEIKYVDAQFIVQFQVSDDSAVEVRNKLLNPNKGKRVDTNRINYIEQSFSLPPTINDEPVDQVKIEGDNIIIGDGLF